MAETSIASTGKDNISPEASPFTVPQISLPKGGGAIRGIGEKFAANPVTGTGSLTVPIAVSPGRSGFGPQLSLSYDSGLGNGPFGIGWSLSLPAITRKTDKGLPQYRDNEESDVFILSGAEDLVPVLKQDSCGKWVLDEFERDGHCVKRYRPRIEGLFARIERWTRLVDGDVHWRSISKDNVLTVYGANTESRISDPANRDHTFSWLICQSYDDKGNAIVYEYVAEGDCGVDLTKANERNRVRTANRYLKGIKYGNRKPLLLDTSVPSFRKPHTSPDSFDQTDWMFEVLFDYGEGHYREEQQDDRSRVFAQAMVVRDRDTPWPVRRDPFSSYRAGFEIRTYRLCRRVLMFHRFPDELGVEDYLVRSTEFEYLEKPIGSFVTRVVQAGYKHQSDGRYLKRSLPALEFTYTPSPLEDSRVDRFEVKEVDPIDVENLPAGIDGGSYKWLDLDGEGISGVLTEQGNAWFYKPNLGSGHFGALESVAVRPSISELNRGRQQLLDVGGDGNLDLVEFDPRTPGFYERTIDAGWKSFRAFASLPNREWNNTNLKFVDVTGDGLADVLITEDEASTWHGSLGKEGFGAAVRVRFAHDEEKGPRVVFADGTQSIYLADMSGDGLQDIVRIRNGEVCYWPNVGYGRFGAKVTMDNGPRFDDPDLFDQRRIRLADTDGSGTTDIVYLGQEGVRIFLNELGNGWSSGRVLRQFPATNSSTSISVVDLLGRGTACLLWSSPLLGDAPRPLRYMDLMKGQKPHLLTEVRNNLGAETVIEYASSTEFYLADKAAGTPWITRLAFPVHVVKRVESYDHISRNRFVTRYTYHHGYFDGAEREFRGFGMVEQLDTEEFAALTQSGRFPTGDNMESASHVPPVFTRTWFHTGAFLEGRRISRHFEHEYYREGDSCRGESELSFAQSEAMLLEDTILPVGLTEEEAREACRSLKGAMLRQEVCALDNKEESPRPYTVAENNFTVRVMQHRARNRHGVFFTHARESLNSNYERKLYDVAGSRRADPRVTHNVTLEVDEYGNVLKSVAIGYGRRFHDASSILDEGDRATQERLLLTFTENRYTNPVVESDAHRVPLPSATLVYELIKVEPTAVHSDMTNLFRFDELVNKVEQASDGAHDLPYEDMHAKGAPTNAPHRRLLKQSRKLYRGNNLERLLPPGALQALALPGEGYKLAFTSGLLSKVYRRPKPDSSAENLLPEPHTVLGGEGGYVDLDSDGHWWIPSGRVFYSPGVNDTSRLELAFATEHFFLPHRFRDPFQNVSTVVYDKHCIALNGARDPVGNTTYAKTDYRVLALASLNDPNDNRSQVAFDCLGMVVGTAVMGKEEKTQGDSLEEFVEDLGEGTILEHVGDPLLNPHDILKKATTRLVYDLFAFDRSRAHLQPQPAVVYTLARETHAADLAEGEQTRIQHSFSYSDGFGREIQKKIQAEPGAHGKPRWAGSGWTIFNNKGKPVRQYEPFFSGTQLFEFAYITGVSSILFYDPVERVVGTLHPNQTYEKLVFDPWRQESWDVNDTVLVPDPGNDPDVEGFLRYLPKSDYLPTWYGQRESSQLGKDEQAAARKAAVHANTPTTAYFDTLGRTFLTVATNRWLRNDSPIEERFATRVKMDIEGNQLSITDALGRRIMSYDYDMTGARVHQYSADASARWMLNDVAGKLLRTWDSRDHQSRYEYDALRRPTNLFVTTGNSRPNLAERTVYGEGHPSDRERNLRGRMFQQFDGAGVITNEQYDFKGNLLVTLRQMLSDYRPEVSWSDSPVLQNWIFTNGTAYDALNRPLTLTAPNGSVIRPIYNDANLLERVVVNLPGSDAATPFVANIDYNAKGQRELIEYGNGVRTSYTYDPLTFRLTHLRTTRSSDGAVLQDLHYTFDPIANITSIYDSAQEKVYFKNDVVSASNYYVYDALYQLIAAGGREHIGQHAAPTFDDSARMNQPLPSDGHAMRRYDEQYHYDAVGNILKVTHLASGGNWTRKYRYDESNFHPANNRLTSTHVGELGEAYEYDAHGNMIRMPHLPVMEWDFKDQLHSNQRQVVNGGKGEKTYYVYGASGGRVRKVTEGAGGTKRKERIYLGGFELYREYGPEEVVTLERETLHVLDNKRRIALVETKTVDADAPPYAAGLSLLRYQFDNHLGCACLELSKNATIISYEEFYPHGGTSFQQVDTAVEVSPKRYRYTGKERDEETGLYYHGARYYACWIGRWTSSDPTGLSGGANLYAYANNSPTCFWDREGRQPTPQVMGNWQYGVQVPGRAALGVNVQVDHPVQVSLRMAQRTSPSGTQFYTRAISKAEEEVGVLAETGKGLFHTEVGKLQRLVNQQVAAGTINGEAELMDATRAIYTQAAQRTGALVDELALDTALLSNQAALSRTTAQTIDELRNLGSAAGSTAADLNIEQSFAETFQLAKSTAAAVQTESSTLNAVSTIVRTESTLARIGQAIAPVANALKPLAPAARFVGRVAGPLGLAVSGLQLATARTTDERVDAGIGTVSSALLMAPHPVAKAAGAGLAVGQVIEKTLNVSEYASAHGMQTYEGLKSLGVNDTVAFVAGGIETVASTPVAILEAATDKTVQLAGRAWNWITH